MMQNESFRVVGVDPGKSGGVCILNGHASGALSFTFAKLPLNDQGDLCFIELTNLFSREAFKGAMVAIEQVRGWHGDAAAHAFTFGYGTATIHCALLASAHMFASRLPKVWQAWHFPKGRKNTDKQLSILACTQWFELSNVIPPGCKVPHDGFMDAALIALAYAMEKGLIGSRPITLSEKENTDDRSPKPKRSRARKPAAKSARKGATRKRNP